MREILFRGKSIKDNEWYEGSLCETKINYPSGETKVNYIISVAEINVGKDELDFVSTCGYDEFVSPETVGQYTGLTAHGKKIFEGDILKFSYTGQNHGVEGVAVVEFENGKFGVKWGWHKEFIPLDGFANTTIEVIGNIHDNPELLGG